MTLAADLLGALGFGVGSALVPVLNAEAYVLVAVGHHPSAIAVVVVALAVGQTLGKLVLFEAARRGSDRFRRHGNRAKSERGWTERIRSALAHPRTAVPLVLGSAGFGLPPLALVSIAAGASGQRRRTFAALCLVGRTARFAAIAVPAAYVGNAWF